MKIDRHFRRYEDITPDLLQKEGINLLLCDLDYTIKSPWVKHPTIRLAHWLQDLQNHGIKVVIISNGRRNRVEKFVKTLHVPFIYKAKKPNIERTIKVIKCISKTALLGDRLHTDIALANKIGIKAWKVPHRFRL